MTGPLDVPSRLVSGTLDGLGSLGAAARRVPEFQRELIGILRRLDRRIEALPEEIEATLEGHFDSQCDAIESLRPELVRNAESAESLPPKIDELLEAIRALGSEVAAVHEELVAVRAAVEPLREPAERVARISDRLPGPGD